MKAWIHSTPLWKQQSSGQDPSFSRHSLPCSLSFPLRSLLFGDPWRTPSLAEPPLARSSRLSFFRRFIPYGSGSSPQNLSNQITQVPAPESQTASRISKRNCSRSKQKIGSKISARGERSSKVLRENIRSQVWQAKRQSS